jgi:hypothetical protein
MYKLIERTNKKVDRELASHYLSFNTYPAQRPVRLAHVQELRDKIIHGYFRHGDIAFATINGKTYMMNGQHVSHAIIDANIPVPCVIEKYECEDECDVATLFRQFEILRRSQKDMVRAKHHALDIRLWPLWISEIVTTAAAMEKKLGPNWYNTRVPQGSGTSLGGISSRLHHTDLITTDEKIELLGKYMGEAEFYYHIVSDDNGKADRNKVRHVARAIVVFMILKTMKINKNDSGIFWNRVTHGENITASKPEYKLREFLKDHCAKIGIPKEFSQAASNHEFAYRIALAWNSFRKNSRTNLAYRSNGIIPKLL